MELEIHRCGYFYTIEAVLINLYKFIYNHKGYILIKEFNSVFVAVNSALFKLISSNFTLLFLYSLLFISYMFLKGFLAITF